MDDQASGTVRSVLNGDTFDLDDGRRLRLARVNAPVAGTLPGLRAWEMLRKLLPPGRQVRYDQVSVSDGLIVAEVWRRDHGVNVNDEMLLFMS